MTYPEAIQFLYNLRLFGAKLGLDNSFKLAAQAGNPHHRLKFIHVAGTNGKGSTCAMLESVYRAAGWRVGLFTSPHLVAFGERIQVNRAPIAEEDIVRLVTQMQQWLAEPIWHAGEHPSDEFTAIHVKHGHPTFFEVITVMAMRYFEEQQCDLVIWETGLGGRLDATNIVTPLASVITNVQFDHQQWLGETLSQIASEKAGIIKPGIPVVTAADAPEALEVIQQVARQQGSPLRVIRAEDAGRPPLDEIELPLKGDHQRMNAALAVATSRLLNTQMAADEDHIRNGLEAVDWPGRFQLAPGPAGQSILLDGAHNIAGIAALRAGLQKYFPHSRPTIVMGVLRDKDWPEMCAMLAPLAGRMILAPVHSERTASPEDLQAVCQKANPLGDITVCPCLSEALHKAIQDSFIVICGSLYLIGEAMELLNLPRDAHTGERALNEWTAATGRR